VCAKKLHHVSTSIHISFKYHMQLLAETTVVCCYSTLSTTLFVIQLFCSSVSAQLCLHAGVVSVMTGAA
jgi:hypothetical protein